MTPTVDEVLGQGGLLARALPGWEARPAQLEMAGAVQGALRAGRPLLVEAGTGTGKTLAYLVPAILSGLKVVVSTGTKNLQEQILKKDVPLLEAHLGVPFRAVQLKGLANYLCMRRFAEGDQAARAMGDESAERDALRAWADRTETGDRGELPDLADDAPIWREVSASPETRLGPRCRFFEQCHITRARRAAQSADLLIVNHHLFFADLTLKARWPQASLLPPYEAVIFDEAHQLEDVATDWFGRSVSSLRVLALCRDVRRAVDQGHLDARTERTIAHLEGTAEALWSELRPRLPRDGRVIADDALWVAAATRAFYQLDTALEEIEGATGSASPDDDGGVEACQALSRRARALRDDLALCADRPAGGEGGRRHVYWAEARGKTVLLHASPVDIAEPFREALLGRVEATIFTSATLTAGGSFDWVRGRLGLDAAVEARLESPFDWSRQALLYLPRDLPEPGEAAFAAAAADRIDELLACSRGRAFLLFTSHRQMQAVHALLASRVVDRGLQILLQGERPKHLLVEAFRARPSVLFATGAFWEGVDVIGEALELVVIDKLPFAPPDDPLVAARCRTLEEQGDDPFAGYQVPQAAIALAQGFGRLIRHRDDRGVVALLDRRAVTRGYGARVLASLPPCPRTSSLADVGDFFARARARRAAQAAAAAAPPEAE